jgi:hypothetical protein
MSSRIIQALMAILLLFSVMPSGIAAASADTNFSLLSSQENPKVGDEVTVVVHGDQLNDLFGYEINLAYSLEKLQFIGASSLISDGFAVPPIVKDGIVTYAFTKIGAATAGVSGAADLVLLKFKTIKTGASEIKLARIKTVNRSKTASELMPDIGVQLLISPALSVSFKDVVEPYWAKPAIERAAALGFVSGYPGELFKPQRVVTRAEYMVMLARALHLQDSNASSLSAFQDADAIGGWAKPYVAKALAEGWIKGFADGTFRPDQPVSRAEMTAIAVRALKLNTEQAGLPLFADSTSIPAWAKPSVAAAAAEGLVKGRGNNKFVPAASANRAEAVVMILKIVDYKNESR